MKNIFIIGTFPNKDYKLTLLESCIDSVKSMGYDILVVSHLPLKESILNKIDYFLYDKENKLIDNELSPPWFFFTDIFSVKCISIKGHALAVSKNIMNGINFAKSLGYIFFFYCESDCIFSENDIVKMEILKNEMFWNHKKAIFFSTTLEERRIFETIFFGGEVDYFHENIFFPLDQSDLEGTTISLERFMYKKYNHLIDNFLITEGHSKDYFSDSKINIDFTKFMVEVFLSNRYPYLHLFIRNLKENPSSMFVQINDDPIKEFTPGYWSIMEIKNIPNLNVKVELDGEVFIKNFNFEDRLSFSKKGFISFN